MFTSCKAMRDGWVGEGRWVRMLGGGGAGESGLTPKTCFRHGVSKHVDQNLPHISGFISEEYIKSLSYYLLS